MDCQFEVGGSLRFEKGLSCWFGGWEGGRVGELGYQFQVGCGLAKLLLQSLLTVCCVQRFRLDPVQLTLDDHNILPLINDTNIIN